jgi:4-cresol dehydrogenase (hydroxylating)
MAILPPDLSVADFARARAELRAALGADWALSSEDDLGPYRDSISPVWDTAQERKASAAIAPANVSQVQAVVRIAGKYRIPLFPISTGRNFGYGGPAEITAIAADFIDNAARAKARR